MLSVTLVVKDIHIVLYILFSNSTSLRDFMSLTILTVHFPL